MGSIRFSSRGKHFTNLISPMGHAVAQLAEALRYKPKVGGSIPDGVIRIFH
jgi:hypothetical protein